MGEVRPVRKSQNVFGRHAVPGDVADVCHLATGSTDGGAA